MTDELREPRAEDPLKSTPRDTSSTLLSRLQDPSDGDAWLRFCEKYAAPMYNWARRAGLDHADAEDVCQEVFTTLVQQMRSFAYDPEQSYRAWLYTVTRRAANEFRRKAARFPQLDENLQAVAEDEVGELLDRTFRQEIVQLAEWRVRRKLARETRSDAAKWRATKRRWAIYVVRTRGEMKPEAIADKYGINRHLVDVDKWRMLERVRKQAQQIEKHGPEFA